MAEEKKKEEATAATKESASAAPQFRLVKLYVKDLSFENPNAPEVFFIQDPEPKVDLNLGVKHKKLDNDHWEVSLAVTATITDTKTEKTLFILEIEHAGAFLLKNIPEQHIDAVLAVECPTFLFPFTRQMVSQMSVDGGFIPFLMEPVNFLGLFENQRRKKKAAEKAAS